ncbi:MAG TPA: SOS response-associated peptidase [Patescibacteria group bacterium]|nr:SOS response-associated peptidase [Patescibacteria group bacterium]
MCGRYTLATTTKYKKRFGLLDSPPKFDESYNISPGTINPVVVKNSPNKIVLMKWGLVPFWSKDPKIGYKMINARCEDIEQKPAFRKPIRSQRCLVPSTGFFEWKKMVLEDKEESFPFFIRLKKTDVFSFAGIYDIWKDAEGHESFSYSIITTAPNDKVAEVHNRMPVILNEKDEEKYLDKDTPLEFILKLLRPIESSKIEFWPVSSLVNNTRNDNKKLIDQI